MRISLWSLLLLSVVNALSFGANDSKKLAKLLGTWNLVSLDDGNGPSQIDGFTIIISERDIKFCSPGGAFKVMGNIHRTDASKKPSQMDLKNGNEIGFGIFELDGEHLKLIVRNPGQERPTEFKGGANGMLFILKREKK